MHSYVIVHLDRLLKVVRFVGFQLLPVMCTHHWTIPAARLWRLRPAERLDQPTALGAIHGHGFNKRVFVTIPCQAAVFHPVHFVSTDTKPCLTISHALLAQPAAADTLLPFSRAECGHLTDFPIP